jgi:hypothetical protein
LGEGLEIMRSKYENAKLCILNLAVLNRDESDTIQMISIEDCNSQRRSIIDAIDGKIMSHGKDEVFK